MRRHTTKFKSLKVALKLERFVRDGHHLETGRPLKRFGGMRSREMLANWLLCAASNHRFGGADRFIFLSAPEEGDGVIYNTLTGAGWFSEHIMARGRHPGDKKDAQAQILEAVEKKQAKGDAAYARGKTLVLFLFSGGDGRNWLPNRVARALPPHDFDAVWVVVFQEMIGGDFVYAVTMLDPRHSPAWRIRVAADFKSWVVTVVQ